MRISDWSSDVCSSDLNVAVLVPNDESIIPALWCYCSSDEYYSNVRKLDEKLGVTNATLAKVPFDLAYWQKVAAEQYPNGLPKPYSGDPAQWIFHGHPRLATDRSEEHTSELQSLMRISYAVFCLTKKNTN